MRVESWAADAYQASSQGSDAGIWKHEEEDRMGSEKTSGQAHHNNHSSPIPSAHTQMSISPSSHRSYSSERSIENRTHGSTSRPQPTDQTQQFPQEQRSSFAPNNVNRYQGTDQIGHGVDISQANSSEKRPIYELA
jgi:hypothetical protein